MEFEWDRAKSDRNEAERSCHSAPFLFDGPVIEHSDDRRAYGEVRIRAIGAIAGSIPHCVYTTRGGVRRVISLRYANRKECDAYRAAYPG